ncbi:M3 family metallopeptidase [Parabacteroides sp. FAFU027]|uniref:M3 family metallopeptidase n=1 Tax=Parabacteroides sp. FAFU027 TaxID=2922715 RepID=UPI001FAFD5F4|nr:M3 family metallopeptidase [Parabacteroides sp. FAFU027]
MKNLIYLLSAALIITSCKTQTGMKHNPFFEEYKTPFGVPPFDKIKNSHYLPAFQEGIRVQAKEIEQIAQNTEPATFKNTIEALEFSGENLKKVSHVFFNLTEAETNDQMQKIAEMVTPMMTEHQDNILLNDKLFQRIKYVNDHKEQERLTTEQKRVLDEYYKEFVRAGALLNPEQKERMRALNKELAMLSLKFGDNLLKETNNFVLVIDKEADLAGLPQSVRTAAAEEAKQRKLEGKWVFTVQKPSMLPFLQYSDKRELREKLYKGYINRGDNNNNFDNKAICAKIIKLRQERSQLLGFKTYADYALDIQMAKTPERVMNLLNSIWTPALQRAKEELSDMQMLSNAERNNYNLQSWDWWYYAEKVRKARYAFDEEQLKPYFKLENVLDGVFQVTHKLYGISFHEIKNAPVYHPDVRAFEVKDVDGSHLGVLYTDYFPRPGKRVGAWMNNIRDQYVQNGKEIRPVIVNVGNFTKPTADAPSLLTLDEVETLFHEFGHAMHGMLTRCSYPKVSGTGVARDFVELPSQLMEHWATAPEVLKMYARHYKTGELIPDSLIQKLRNASKFNQGFNTTELVAAAILDMDWHLATITDSTDVRKFETDAMNKIGLINEIIPRYRTTYFKHIFDDGGYSAGYYSYLWAEVLDADAFEAFEQSGNIFNQEIATRYRQNILEKGGSDEPMKLYIQFRGAEPNPDALLKNRGLK